MRYTYAKLLEYCYRINMKTGQLERVKQYPWQYLPSEEWESCDDTDIPLGDNQVLIF